MINDIYQLLNNDDELRVNFSPNINLCIRFLNLNRNHTYINMKHTVSPKWHIKRNIRYHTLV